MNDPCKAKQYYIDEVDWDTPIVRKQSTIPKKRVFDNSYNKNGIRRA